MKKKFYFVVFLLCTGSLVMGWHKESKENMAKTKEINSDVVTIIAEVEFKETITDKALEVTEVTQVTQVTEETIEVVPFGYECIPLDESIRKGIHDICVSYGLSFEIMMGIAKQESNFDVNAYNKCGDYGLFQVNRKHWEKKAQELGLDYKNNVFHNAEMACYIFNQCLNKADGDIRKALNIYRTGKPYNKYECGSDYATIVMKNANWIGENK